MAEAKKVWSVAVDLGRKEAVKDADFVDMTPGLTWSFSDPEFAAEKRNDQNL